jgi:hypothetical protein
MKTIYVGVASRNLAFWGMYLAFQNAAGYALKHGYKCYLAPIVGDSLISRARNEMLAAFLNDDLKCEYFFSLDDDIELPPTALVDLINSDKDIVGGLYRLKNDSRKVAIRGYESFNVKDFPNQVKEVQYLSTGCMMHKREVLESLWGAYPELSYLANQVNEKPERRALYMPYIYNREYLSEDWAFCQRAVDKGHKIYLHTGVICAHWGLKRYDGGDN